MPWVGSSIPITEYVVVPEWPSWPWFCRPSQQAPIQLDEDSCLGCRDLLRARGPRLAVHRLQLPPVHSGGLLSHGCGHLHVFPAKSYFAKSSASSLSPYRLFVPGNRPSTFLWLDLWEFIKGRFPSIGFCDCHGPVRPGLALLEVCSSRDQWGIWPVGHGTAWTMVLERKGNNCLIMCGETHRMLQGMGTCHLYFQN